MKKEEIKNTEDQELDWDSELNFEDDSRESYVPPVGEYGFTVIEFEKTFSKAGNKMAKLNLQLDETGRNYKVYDYIVLSQKNKWKICKFFESLGLKEKGESLPRMPWEKVVGKSGRITIKHEEYNGKTSVKVDEYVLSEQEDALPFDFEE